MTSLEVATPVLVTRSFRLGVRITRSFGCQQGKARLPDRNWAWMSQGLTPPATATMQAKIKVIKIFNECTYVCTRLDQDYSWPPMSYVHVRACMRNFHRHAKQAEDNQDIGTCSYSSMSDWNSSKFLSWLQRKIRTLAIPLHQASRKQRVKRAVLAVKRAVKQAVRAGSEPQASCSGHIHLLGYHDMPTTSLDGRSS